MCTHGSHAWHSQALHFEASDRSRSRPHSRKLILRDRFIAHADDDEKNTKIGSFSARNVTFKIDFAAGCFIKRVFYDLIFTIGSSICVSDAPGLFSVNVLISAGGGNSHSE